jgi:hypothetical protein
LAKSSLNVQNGGAPGGIRTPGLLVRSQALYPTELRARIERNHSNTWRSIGGEGGIRTLEGLLNHPKTLRNQQLADSQQVAVPCIPLISPSLAVELAVDAQLSVRSLYPTGTGHCRIVRKCALGSESVSAPHFDAVAKTKQPLVGSSGGPNHVPPSSASVRLAHKRR